LADAQRELARSEAEDKVRVEEEIAGLERQINEQQARIAGQV